MPSGNESVCMSKLDSCVVGLSLSFGRAANGLVKEPALRSDLAVCGRDVVFCSGEFDEPPDDDSTIEAALSLIMIVRS